MRAEGENMVIDVVLPSVRGVAQRACKKRCGPQLKNHVHEGFFHIVTPGASRERFRTFAAKLMGDRAAPRVNGSGPPSAEGRIRVGLEGGRGVGTSSGCKAVGY